MKISLEWLSEYLPAALSAEAAATALTFGGLPVEVIEQVGNDVVIDVEVTSNRGDCLSHIGIARELGALLNRETKLVNPVIAQTSKAATEAVGVRVEVPSLCPHYIARVIRGVTVARSPQWMVRRLEAVGLRAVNNIVDITNYVMLEMGQPLHAFDYDRLNGQQIVVRNAQRNEKLFSIDGHERSLAPDMLVIADSRQAVALAGVMGGRESEVSDSTGSIVIESARFDPLSVRKAARTLAMRSESSYRFERGIDPELPERASQRAAQLILELAGGELLSGAVEARFETIQTRSLMLRLNQLPRILGFDVPTSRVIESLQRIGLQPRMSIDRIEVTVPSHRLDITQEIDLIEEVARLGGYDQIPFKDVIEVRTRPTDPSIAANELIRDTLVGAGYFEAVTFSFVSDAIAGSFKPEGAISLPRADSAVRKSDAQLRPSLLPGLLQAVRHNENVGNENSRFFEIGSVFWSDVSGKIVEQRKLALVGTSDYREVRGTIEVLLRRLNADRSFTVKPSAEAGYAEGATGILFWENQCIGTIGQLDASVGGQISLRARPIIAELDLDPLLKHAALVPQLRPLPRFPAVRRDLSFVVKENVPYQKIQELVSAASPDHLEETEYVTTYTGKPLENGTKSVTITLVFRSTSETLTSDAVEKSVAKVIDAAKAKLGASLRV